MPEAHQLLHRGDGAHGVIGGSKHLYRLYRDVGDDSPWYDKALFEAITTLEDIADGSVPAERVRIDAMRRLQDIERTLEARGAE